MLEIAGLRSRATGRACEETGIATAAPSSSAIKRLDLNMVRLVLVTNRTITGTAGSIIPGAARDRTSRWEAAPQAARLEPPTRRSFPERHYDRVVVAEYQVDAVRIMH